MPAFAFKAWTREGELRSGVLTAADPDTALEAIRAMNALPVRVWPAAPHGQSSLRGAEAAWSRRAGQLQDKDVYDFFSGLGTLGGSLLALDDSLDLLAEGLRSRHSQRLARFAAEQMREGASFSGALGTAPAAGLPAMPPVALALLQAGEEAGDVPGACTKISTLMAQRMALSKALRDALAYPALVTVIALAGLYVLGQVVVPSFAPIFAAQEVEPPAIMGVLSMASGILPVALIFLSVAGLWILRSTSAQVKRRSDGLILRLPGLGRAIAGVQAARFASALAALLKAGCGLSAAVQRAAGTADNTVLRRELQEAAQALETGASPGQAFAGAAHLPFALRRLLPLAERSGRIVEAFEQSAALCEAEAKRRIDRLMEVLSPALITGVGLLAGFVILSLFDILLTLNETVT